MLSINNHAYVYECGDLSHDFTKDGSSSYFLLSAIIVAPHNIEALAKVVQAKIHKFGELNSQFIGNDYKRRTRILKAFFGCSISYYLCCY